MTRIQVILLDYLKSENNENITEILDDIHDDKHEFKSFLHLLVKISNNHHRESNFFVKIEQIIHYLKNDLKKHFTNSELFLIFKSNKRILLILFEENILIMDENIAKNMIQRKYLKAKYPQYFQPEIKKFVNEEWFQKMFIENNEDEESDGIKEMTKELPEDFSEKRKTGENDTFICELIRNDSIDEFIVYVNKNSISFQSTFIPTIYETNNFLVKKADIELIEYAAFYGSIQIFNYLRSNGSELTTFLWFYAIHGNNAEIIQILEENTSGQDNSLYENCFIESIKCHHNNMANYFQNLLTKNDENQSYNLMNSIKYYNFNFIQNDMINKSSFVYLCQYDYYIPVSIIFNEIGLNINKSTIIFNKL